VIPGIWPYIRPSTSFKRYKGKWAVVVGAGEGLGGALALGLAKRGMNVVIVARTESKLHQVAEQIRALNQQAITVVADVVHESFRSKLDKALQGLDVAFLVNNAGGTVGNVLREFLDYTEQEVETMRLFNTGYILQTIRMILPRLVSNKFGGILNVGSLSTGGALYLIPYSSEKAKLNSLTESLAFEYEPYGITIQCALAARVLTANIQSSFDLTPSWSCPLPKTVAESVLNMFGSGGPLVTPYWGHALQGLTFSAPSWIKYLIVKSVYKDMMRIQKRKN